MPPDLSLLKHRRIGPNPIHPEFSVPRLLLSALVGRLVVILSGASFGCCFSGPMLSGLADSTYDILGHQYELSCLFTSYLFASLSIDLVYERI